MFEILRLFLFRQTLPKIVPLILSQRELKLMSLIKKGSDRYVLDKFIYKFFEFPAFDSEKASLSNDFNQFIKRFSFANRKIVLLLPELPILQDLIRYESVFLKKKNINEFITTELVKHFPFRVDELLYDYNIDEEKDMIEFLLVAVPRRKAQNFIDIFNSLRVSQIVLPTMSEEIVRALKPIIHIDKNYLVIIIEFSYVAMVIIEKGKIILTHQLRQKIFDTFNHVKKVFNLNYDYITEAFLAVGVEQNQHKKIENLQLQKNLLEFIENLRADTSKLLSYYSAGNAKNNKLDEIFLVGKFAHIKGLKDYFESNYRVKVVVPDPFEINNINITNIALDVQLRKSLTETPAAFVDSVGLAIRCVGLDPEENGLNLLIRS